MVEITNELLLKAKAFDNDAIELIFDYFRLYIKNLAFRYFLVGSDKDDVIQEGMIGLFSAIKSYDLKKDTSFESFAKQCIVLRLNTAVKNSLRKKHIPLNNSLSLNDEAGELEVVYFEDPLYNIIDNENVEALNAKLTKILSKFELSVLYLLNSGMTYKEIASVLGRSAKSIDNALQRIKKKAAPILSVD